MPIVWGRMRLGRRLADLSDPFETRATRIVWRRAGRAHVDKTTLSNALALYDTGAYDRALRRLQGLDQRRRDMCRRQCLRYQAWIQCRRGWYREAIQALDDLDGTPQDLFEVTQRVLVYKHAGLQANDAIQTWLEKGEMLLSEHHHRDLSTEAAFLGHHGYVMMKRGDFELTAR